MNMPKCSEGCIFHERIMKHPWNESDPLKGLVSELAGYGCSAPKNTGGDGIIFFEREGVGCELHTVEGKR